MNHFKHMSFNPSETKHRQKLPATTIMANCLWKLTRVIDVIHSEVFLLTNVSVKYQPQCPDYINTKETVLLKCCLFDAIMCLQPEINSI